MRSIRVFYLDDLADGYRPGPHPRTLIFEGTIAATGEDMEAAEAVWVAFNRCGDSPNRLLDSMKQRSMCVGDVVEFVDAGRFYVAASMGFELIEEALVGA